MREQKPGPRARRERRGVRVEPGTFRTVQVARIIGVPPHRVRSWVRRGMCRPGRHGRAFRFSFQDLVLLRTARGLLDQNVSVQRIRRILRDLSRQIPPGKPLSSLQIRMEGKSVVVHDGRVAWQPESGQTVLLFHIKDLQRDGAAPLRIPERKSGDDGNAGHGPETALEWFEKALAVEDENPKQACLWYRRALHLDPELTDAYVNLGRILHEAGDARSAVRLYLEALARSPRDAVTHDVLGLALEDLREPARAEHHYREAIHAEPGFADAHFHLARLLEEQGRRGEAARHMEVYAILTGDF